MINFARLYDAKQAMIVHATATNYRERSHFDGQDVLESGRLAPGHTESGWLNRAVAALPKGERVGARGALAVGYTAPLVMRGPAPILGWAPSGLAAADRGSRGTPDEPLRARRSRARQGLASGARRRPHGEQAGHGRAETRRRYRAADEEGGDRRGAADERRTMARASARSRSTAGTPTPTRAARRDASRNCWAVSTASSPRSRVNSDRAGRRRSSSRSPNSAAPPASTARSARTTEPARSPSSRGARWRAGA